MATLAEAHGYAVVEMAIKRRTRDDPSGKKPKLKGLRAAINHACDEGWLKSQEFEYQSSGTKKSSLDDLVWLRNDLAHGNPHLHPDGSVMLMELCHKIIVALFP